MIYREPDFCNIKVGSKVLTKQKNMWHRSIILKLPEKDGDEYRIKFESSGKIAEASLQDLLPLGKNILKIYYTSCGAAKVYKLFSQNLLEKFFKCFRIH